MLGRFVRGEPCCEGWGWSSRRVSASRPTRVLWWSGLARGSCDWGPGRCSLGFHHELFQRLLPLIPTKQKNFFDFILLETHIVKLS